MIPSYRTGRWIAYAAALALLFTAPVWLTNCIWQPVPPSTPTAVLSPVLPATLPATIATSTTVPNSPQITQDEAQTIVRAWFAAILAQDYPTASALTSGAATDRTRELAEGFQKATGGNPVELSGNRLDLSPGEIPAEGGQAVKGDFELQVNARMGPIMVAVQQIIGSAVFVVGRADGQTRITDIREVMGLPTEQ